MSSNVTVPMGKFQYNPAAGGNLGFNVDYIDMCSSMYPSYPMGGSIFGSYPVADASSLGIGFGAGIGPIFSGGTTYNNQSYFDYMKDYQKFNNQYYIDQQKMNRNADLQVNGAMEAIQETAANLRDKILKNEQDQVLEAYRSYVDAVRNAYGQGKEEEINARALNLYQQLTGKTLIQDLRDNGHSSALQGFIQSITLGLYSQKSAEDNISQITGQPVATGEKTEQNLGRLAGVATIGGVAYGAVKALAGKTGKIAQTVTKFCKGKAGIVGLAVAGLAAGITFLTGKIST